MFGLARQSRVDDAEEDLGVGSVIQAGVTEPWQLLELARDTVPQSRYTLATSMTDLYADRQGALSDREEDLIEDILDRLVRSFESDLRRSLAERLAAREHAPHELVLMLCNDQIEVAGPLLRHGAMLDDAVLIDVIRRRGEAHQLAIAERPGVGTTVSEALVGTANVVVIEALLRNPAARFTEETLEHLVDEARWVECYRDPLAHREDLTVELARRLYSLVSVALRQHILGAYDIDAGALEEELESVIEERIAEVEAAAGPPDPTDAPDEGALAALQVDLVGVQDISPRILVRVLRNGELELFESLLGELACISKDRLSHILAQPSGRSLAVICRALGIAKPDYAVMLFLTRRLRGTGQGDDPRSIARMIEFYSDLDPKGSMEALRQWRRDPSYREAIAAIEQNGGPGRSH